MMFSFTRRADKSKDLKKSTSREIKRIAHHEDRKRVNEMFVSQVRD